MKVEALEFVTAIRHNVIETGGLMYQTSFEKAVEGTVEATDPVWKEIIPIYISLTKEQKEDFLEFLRLVQVNAVSQIFGILDGSSFLSKARENLILTVESSGKAINGDLQDIFLAMEEE